MATMNWRRYWPCSVTSKRENNVGGSKRIKDPLDDDLIEIPRCVMCGGPGASGLCLACQIEDAQRYEALKAKPPVPVPANKSVD